MAEQMPLTLAELAVLLRFIPACGRETWVQVGMGIKAEFGQDGWDAWDAWSQSGTGYKLSDAKTVWRSFRKGGTGLGTVIKLAMDNGWTPEKKELSAEDKRRFAREQEARRLARQAEVEADDALLQRMRALVASQCAVVWAQHVTTEGESGYLAKKQVAAFAVGFMRHTVVLEIDDQAERCQLWVGEDAVQYLRSVPSPRPAHLSMLVLRRGDLVMPLRDAAGQIHSLQQISSTGKKLFPKYGRKSGCFHVLARLSEAELAQAEVIGLAEGYATAASCQMATGWPMVAAIDSGNLPRVAEALRALNPAARLMLCGDDDPNAPGNPGRTKAEAAARAVGGVAVFPAGDAGKDWNDLHVAAGLDAVREQLLAVLAVEPGAKAKSAARMSLEAFDALLSGEGGAYPTDSLAAAEDVTPLDGRKPDVGGQAPADDWKALLKRTEGGGLQPQLMNAYLILQHAPAWAGVLAYNQFAERIEKLRPPPVVDGERGPWVDVDASKALVWLQMVWGLGMRNSAVVDEAARMVAWDNRYHPVRQWLDALPAWDGVPRLERLMEDVFGAEPNDYTRHIGKSLLVSAVARVLRPGCKVDEMVVLEGAQGLGKSTCIAELFGPEWYLETSEAPTTKDFYVVMQGNWVVEIGEMQSFSKADINQVKMAITRRDDKYRAPYDRHGSSHPRQCIFIGTTNADTYLSDPTGARRFLPVLCDKADVSQVRFLRLEYWAEALALFRQGFRWWDYPKDIASAEQDARYVEDAWEEAIADYLDGKAPAGRYPADCAGPMDEVTIMHLLQYALQMDIAKMNKPEQRRVADILRRMGWERGKQERVPGSTARIRPYRRPAPARMAAAA